MDRFLGQKTGYKAIYDNSLLVSIERKINRQSLSIDSKNFYGFDIWNCYELSFLSQKNKPEVRILEIFINSNSDNIIESKSLKLYLNSFNNSNFANDDEVLQLIQHDLSKALNSDVILHMKKLEMYQGSWITNFNGTNLDILDVEMKNFYIEENMPYLSGEDMYVEEILFSNLLKSNCLVTHQPDWGTIQINYKGLKIHHRSLLKYIISFRNHNEFHEHCIEQMFDDIMKHCNPNELTIYGRYTRRGGIDINPIRSTNILKIEEINNFRQIRQ
jgi:7-cyano-7-deazaguanine reductase